MKLRNFVLAGALVLGTTGVANAGTGVTNQTIIRNTTGHGTFKASGYETTVKNQVNTSQSIKAESNYGDTNISTVTYENGELSGSATSFNNVPQDPVAIITVSEQVETVNITGYSEFGLKEVYDFTEYSNTHNVNSVAF